jgi:hypothetical protein|nr:MAG TPA_asm: hypothetical protein [Bacteriophage sp.]
MRDTGLSASDVALLSGNNGRNNDGMFGDNWAWIIVLFLIFAFGGWGNGFGFNGGNGSNGSGALDNYVLASDFATIQRQLSDGFNDLTSQSRYIQNGLCDGFYNQAQLINGVNSNIAGSTAALQNTLCQGFNGVNQGITINGYESRNAIQGVSSQLASCCCNLRSDIQGVNYNLATNTCALQNTMNTNTRDIVDTVNANYRALHDEIVANRIEDKNAQIAAQQNEINSLRLSASQANQNQYLINQLKPCASPAYIVPNPNCCYNYNVTGCCNGCGNY